MRTEQPRDGRRGVPRTDVVLADPRLVAATSTLSRATLRNAVAMVQERARRGEIPMDAVADVVAASLPARATTLRPVINATGVVLHTNLGRAPLSTAATDALRAAGHTDVEFDLATGERAKRGRGTLDALAAAVPAAESVHVVNNGAAALVLAATALAAGREVIVIGSGLLTGEPLLPDEPDATTALEDGAALITASGDKLLGGPQAGLLLGRAGVVDRLRRHPLARALRVDKLTLAALEATLRGPESPTWQALHREVRELRARARALAGKLREQGTAAEAAETVSVVGGGGAPEVELPSSATLAGIT